jgi:hypothetical protein
LPYFIYRYYDAFIVKVILASVESPAESDEKPTVKKSVQAENGDGFGTTYVKLKQYNPSESKAFSVTPDDTIVIPSLRTFAQSKRYK